MYDEEALYQDADIEQYEAEMLGNHIAALEADGVCTHGHTLGRGDGNGPLEGGFYYPQQRLLKPGQRVCSGCGDLFENDEDWYAARQEVLS